MRNSFLSLVLFLGFSGASLAATDTNLYGKGTWKDNAGKSGSYNLIIKKSAVDDTTLNITETMVFDADHKEYSYTIKKLGKSFFDVRVGETKVGRGYCDEDIKPMHKVCHLEYSNEGHKGERTMSINKLTHEIKRFGSCESEDGTIVLFKDKAHKKMY